MNIIECSREQDVLDALASRRWSEDLRAHVESCAVCSDVKAIAAAFQEDHAAAWADARVPPSGAVWWRLELRARSEAARAASRPITVVHTIAAACAAIVLVAFAGFISPWFRQQLSSFTAFRSWSFQLPAVDVGAMLDMAFRGGVPLALAAAVWLVLVPVAVYFAISEE